MAADGEIAGRGEKTNPIAPSWLLLMENKGSFGKSTLTFHFQIPTTSRVFQVLCVHRHRDALASVLGS